MKCIVIEDLPIALKGMTRLIGSREELEIIGTYESAEEALLDTESMNAELAFIDICLSGMSGMELARKLPVGTLIVFTTAYSEYALESYDIQALDYLVKPIDPAKFNRAVDKALAFRRRESAERELDEISNSGKDFINVKSDRKFIRIKYDDIKFIEGSGNSVIFHLENDDIYTRATLKSIIDQLPSITFMRVNKSYVVNKHKISAFNNSDIFIGTYEISIGSKYRDGVMSYLMK